MNGQDLKNSILQLAMQGKLVEQRTEEGTGEDLYQQIQEKKQKLIAEGKLKKEKPLPEIEVDEIPFEIPESWKWVKLGYIATIKGGKRIPAGKKLQEKDNGNIYVRVTNMKNGSILDSNILYVPDNIYEKISQYVITKDDVYITVAGSIGDVGLVPKKFHNANLTENADRIIVYKSRKEFIYFMLSSPIVQQQIRNATTKVGQPKLAIKRIQNLVVPLPPLKEQIKIVDKLYEVLPLVEEYGKLEGEREDLDVELSEKLKKSILQYAMQGKLVPQIPSEGTAEELYAQIQEEKQKLIEQGKLKKEKPLPPITSDEIPFQIPPTWKWVRFGNAVNFYMGKTPPRADLQWWSDDVPWVSIADMPENGYVSNTKECVSARSIDKIFNNRISSRGTLLMSFKLTVGRVSILSVDAVHNEAIISINPGYNNIEAFKYYLFFILPIIANFGDSKDAIKGSTLNKKSINNLLVPLPPEQEQKRLVDKINQIYALYKELRKDIV